MLLLKWSQNYFQVKSKAALTNISERPEKRDIVNVFHLVALLYPKIQDRISVWEGFTTHRTGPRYKQGNVGHTVQLVFPTNDSEIPNCPTKPQPHSHPQSGHDRSIYFQIGAVKQQNQSAHLCGASRRCPGWFGRQHAGLHSCGWPAQKRRSRGWNLWRTSARAIPHFLLWSIAWTPEDVSSIYAEKNGDEEWHREDFIGPTSSTGWNPKRATSNGMLILHD